MLAIRKPSDLGYSDKQQDEYRQYKGEFHKGLPPCPDVDGVETPEFPLALNQLDVSCT